MDKSSNSLKSVLKALRQNAFVLHKLYVMVNLIITLIDFITYFQNVYFASAFLPIFYTTVQLLHDYVL